MSSVQEKTFDELLSECKLPIIINGYGWTAVMILWLLLALGVFGSLIFYKKNYSKLKFSLLIAYVLLCFTIFTYLAVESLAKENQTDDIRKKADTDHIFVASTTVYAFALVLFFFGFSLLVSEHYRTICESASDRQNRPTISNWSKVWTLILFVYLFASSATWVNFVAISSSQRLQ